MNEPEPSTEAKAAAYESAHRRLFLLRLLVTVAAIAGYQLTGASANLADGLAVRFGDATYAVVTMYLAITIFGFAVLMFPLSLYGDHLLEHQYGMSNQTFGAWMFDFVKSLALEIVLGVLFFGALYAILAFGGALWWVLAAGMYLLFSVVLSTLVPVVILPMFHDVERVEDSPLTERITKMMTEAGLVVVGVYRWGLSETTQATNAALTGLGRTRRIILGDTMLDQYSQDEILAVLAHEVGHYRHRDMARFIVVATSLALVGFFLADVVLRALVPRFGFAGIAEVGSFPILVLGLLVFSLVTLPLTNAHSRAREYAADAYAVRALGSAAPLVSALEKLAVQNLAERRPPAWIEALLYSHPSIEKRIAHARAVEAGAA